jgi:hypothetical protein
MLEFHAVLQAGRREILPELALPTDARATIETIDACGTDLTALCLSGGGIRSATFALGVLQGLARFGLLGQHASHRRPEPELRRVGIRCWNLMRSRADHPASPHGSTTDRWFSE